MRYTSDLSDSQWEIVKEHIGKPGNKSKYEKRELVNAVLYVEKTGCQRRNLPADFPKWTAVYQFFKRAKMSGLWEKINMALVKKVRSETGRTPEPSYALIDSQSAKTVYASLDVGFDGGKNEGQKTSHSYRYYGQFACSVCSCRKRSRHYRRSSCLHTIAGKLFHNQSRLC